VTRKGPNMTRLLRIAADAFIILLLATLPIVWANRLPQLWWVPVLIAAAVVLPEVIALLRVRRGGWHPSFKALIALRLLDFIKKALALLFITFILIGRTTHRLHSQWWIGVLVTAVLMAPGLVSLIRSIRNDDADVQRQKLDL